MAQRTSISGEHHPSDPTDPGLILAMRREIDQAIVPVLTEIRTITTRLASGDTQLALMQQVVDRQANDCLRHRQDLGSERQIRRRDMNPLVLVILSAVVTTVANLTLVWWLTGIGQIASKGSS